MRKTVTMLGAALMLGMTGTYAGALGPQPELIAKYERDFIERSGAQTFGEMLDTGIIRYFFTGGRELLIMVNGRPYATTASSLDSLPLSAIERIEVLRAESLGTVVGQAAVRGAFNLVLRDDLDGFDVRSVVRAPTRDGGDARQGSVVWGGEVGTGGHMTISADVLSRNEIEGKSREHSRSEWEEGGSFADATNVSVGGNTVYIFDVDEEVLRTVPLGECDPNDGYTGPLSNPPGIRSGDTGCGFAYGKVWWDTESYKQKNAILNLRHPFGERGEIHVDANVTQGQADFRYAPSVDVFSITPSGELLDAINMAATGANPPFEATTQDIFSIGHRFTGHGNRDWKTTFDIYDLSARLKGQISDTLGYDTRIEVSKSDGEVAGDTFVDREIIREEIAAGRYNLADPLSTDTAHREAIRRSSLHQETDFASEYYGARLALEGEGPRIGARNIAWTSGVEISSVEAHSLLSFRTKDGQVRDVDTVLGSGGTSYKGGRDTMGAFAELTVPVIESVDLRAAARADDYDDIGALHTSRLGALYRVNDLITLRGSWSRGDSAPLMHHLHSTALQDHPYVRCVPESGDPPRTCDKANYRQVKRRTTGNADLEPSRSERRSIGIEARTDQSYFLVDWYWLETFDLPGRHNPSWSMLNHPECPPGGGSACIERAGGEITINEHFENIVDTEVSGVNTRFGTRVDTSWGFAAVRGFWRYVTDSAEAIAGEEQAAYPLPRNAIRIVGSTGRGNVAALWAVNYRDSIDNRSGDGEFKSWTGHDLTLDWKKPMGLENTRATIGVYNVTDTKLSTNTANPSATDGPTAAGWGRTLFATLNMRF